MHLLKFKRFNPVLFGLLLTIISCTDKSEDDTVIGNVSFSSNDIIEVEAATQPLTINLGVDTFNHLEGIVHIEVEGGVYDQDYTLSTGSDSFDITIVKGSQLASFSVMPINDNVVESNIDLTFTITNVSGGLQAGSDIEYKLTILNDDTPTIGTINFANSTYTVDENDITDKVIDIAFNQVSTYGGTITIASTGSAVFGTDYSIQNQTTGNFTLNVPPLATSASFVVNSIDDTVQDNNKNLIFTITGVTGGLQVQSPNATTIAFIDNDIIPIPINYVETFEGYNNSSTYLTTTLGYQVLTVNQSSNITYLMNVLNAAGGFSDVSNQTLTSNNGINFNYTAGNPVNTSLIGDLDQVLISPNMNANGNVTFSIDYNHTFTAQNNATVSFYWSETYSSGPFNLSQWTLLGTDTAANLIAEGYASNVFKRRTFSINPQNNFKIAIRVNQNINVTNYRTRWRFDNIKLTN